MLEPMIKAPLKLALTAFAALALTQTGACSKAAATANAPAGAARQGPAQPPPVTWITWSDPSEQAFTLEVPAGWTATGGSRRMSAVEIRTGVTVRSPDGQIELFYGDADIPVFTTPNQMLAMGGFNEGSVYSPGYGQQLVVARYQSGQGFAQGWGAQRVARSCQDVAAAGARPLPSAGQAMDMAYANGGVRTSINVGEASFACRLNGAPAAAYVFAGTERVDAQGFSLWDVKHLAGFIAPKDREAEAAAMLARLAGSFRIDPQWAARQQGLTAGVSRIVADTGETMRRTIHDSYASTTASRDRALADHDRKAVRGTDLFDDPVAGRVELPNAGHQWRTPDGRHVATESATPPVPGAVELPRVSN